MQQRYIDYSRVVAVMAQQDVLPDDVAQQYCKEALPRLIAELDVLSRLADAKFASVLTVPVEQPAPVEQDMSPTKPAKKRRKPPARKRNHDSTRT
jgi:hypothetical protein